MHMNFRLNCMRDYLFFSFFIIRKKCHTCINFMASSLEILKHFKCMFFIPWLSKNLPVQNYDRICTDHDCIYQKSFLCFYI